MGWPALCCHQHHHSLSMTIQHTYTRTIEVHVTLIRDDHLSDRVSPKPRLCLGFIFSLMHILISRFIHPSRVITDYGVWMPLRKKRGSNTINSQLIALVLQLITICHTSFCSSRHWLTLDNCLTWWWLLVTDFLNWTTQSPFPGRQFCRLYQKEPGDLW